MRLHIVIFFASIVTVALVRAVPHFRNTLHIFQMFAKDMYPEDLVQQKNAVLTLKYLFRNEQWNQQDHWQPIDDFIRTGGLNIDVYTRKQVLVQNVFLYLQQPTLYQPFPYLRPSLNTLILYNLKEAKKMYRDDLLTEPPNLGTTQRMVQVAPLFRNLPKPMTLEEAEAKLGDSWKAGTSSSSEQKRIHGGGWVPDIP